MPTVDVAKGTEMKFSRVYKTKQKTVEKAFPLDAVLASDLDSLVEAWVNESGQELLPLVLYAEGYDPDAGNVTFRGIPSSVKTKSQRDGEQIIVKATVTWKELSPKKGFSYLDIDNNWGHKTYTLKGAKLRPGSKATIVLPNNTDVLGSICFQPETNSVSDHGHSSDVTSMVPHLEVDFLGNPMLVNLEDAQMKVSV